MIKIILTSIAVAGAVYLFKNRDQDIIDTSEQQLINEENETSNGYTAEWNEYLDAEWDEND